MSIALANASIIVNNEPVAIVPNSVSYTEGKGEQTIRAASVGGGSVEQIYAQDITSNFSMIKFEIYNDIEAIEDARAWKNATNTNLVQMTGSTPDGKTINRTFSQAAILNDYEVNLGADTTIEIEFKSNAAV